MLKPTPGVNPPDTEAVSQLTLRALFDSEESALLRYAFLLTGRRAVAEDIVQEVFLQLHAHWNEVEAPKAWLKRSVRNRAFNYIRDHKREVLRTDDQDSLTQSSRDMTPEEMLERMEATAALRETVEQLDEADRKLVQLKYFEDLKYREISEQTGLSISNVGYRLHHILKELATKLQPLGVDKIHE
jgi:RNA polymerase sigma factor (sigma-70 family)